MEIQGKVADVLLLYVTKQSTPFPYPWAFPKGQSNLNIFYLDLRDRLLGSACNEKKGGRPPPVFSPHFVPSMTHRFRLNPLAAPKMARVPTRRAKAAQGEWLLNHAPCTDGRDPPMAHP